MMACGCLRECVDEISAGGRGLGAFFELGVEFMVEIEQFDRALEAVPRPPGRLFNPAFVGEL